MELNHYRAVNLKRYMMQAMYAYVYVYIYMRSTRILHHIYILCNMSHNASPSQQSTRKKKKNMYLSSVDAHETVRAHGVTAPLLSNVHLA